AEWTAACKKWVDMVIAAPWNPRKALLDISAMAEHAKHLLATDEADAIEKSKINAQYWPKTGHEQLVRHTLLDGQWVRGGSTVHAYFDFGRVVGYDGGKPSTNHRAEITQATPPQMHGHPRISKD
ncbi:MAG TPA: hypothetical protein VHN14_06060, partial [Kofleriaceae bacterium]|nr:hypothetical protein [Kofleriaceae bacterium]